MKFIKILKAAQYTEQQIQAYKTIKSQVETIATKYNYKRVAVESNSDINDFDKNPVSKIILYGYEYKPSIYINIIKSTFGNNDDVEFDVDHHDELSVDEYKKLLEDYNLALKCAQELKELFFK